MAVNLFGRCTKKYTEDTEPGYNSEFDTVAGKINRRVKDHTLIRPTDVIIDKWTNTVLTPIVGDGTKPYTAWLATKHNPAHGFYLTPPDKNDEKWFNDQGKPLKGVMRYHTEKGNTGLVKLDPVKGTVAFFDNEKYENTNKIYWERPLKYEILLVTTPAMDYLMTGK